MKDSFFFVLLATLGLTVMQPRTTQLLQKKKKKLTEFESFAPAQ